MSVETLAKFIAKYILISLDVGLVWLLAWIFNTGLTSDQIWFIGLLFAAVQSNIYWTVRDNAR
jgi:hypothetical protein